MMMIQTFFDELKPAAGITTFSSTNPVELGSRERLIIQEERSGDDTNRFDEETVAVNDEI